MSSIVIIGKGPSVKRCTKHFIDSFDEVAICNHPVYDGYEHLISNHANYDFINVGDPNPYLRNRLHCLGIHTIINTGGRCIHNPPASIVPENQCVQYIPFYRGECLDYFKTHYQLDPSTGIMAFHYFINKPEYNKIALVGFDLFEQGTPVYYFKKKELSPTLHYLLDKGVYDEQFRIVYESGHNTQRSHDYLIEQMKTYQDKEFILYTNYPFEKMKNVTIV